MKILNVHERTLKLTPQVIGTAIDSLAGPDDIIWPRDKWPAMEFDLGLCVGAKGGHGVVRYEVEEYIPGKRAVFRFDGTGMTAGLDGRHFFEVLPHQEHIIIRHVIDAKCNFPFWLTWYFLIRPLHDALLEDGLDQMENKLMGSEKATNWSPWVKFIRSRMAKAREQKEKQVN